MNNRPSRIAFILASSAHGPLILNRLDFHTVGTSTYGVGIQILEHGAFDPAEVNQTRTLLTLRRKYRGDGVVAIDCGANIGVHTIEWARQMEGWGSVIAIEAQERVFYALAGNIAINNCFNARAIHAVISSRTGFMRIPALNHQKPASFGSLELVKRNGSEQIGQPIDYSEMASVDTPMITLDSLTLARCDLIKIDVEGMELSVLDGAAHTIEQHRPIIHVEILKTGADALKSRLVAIGYQTFDVGQNCLAIHSSDPTLSHVAPQSEA
jgi:FkbM family methyltransferase